MKKLLLTVLFLVIAGGLLAQPMHYNATTGSGNTFPFGQSAGKAVNWLFPPNVFSSPTPCPSGQEITKIYCRMYGSGTRAYTNLHILMAQTTLTNLTTGQFYAGPYDTVFAKDTSLTSTGANTWMGIQLHTPFAYDPTKALVVFIGQCGGAGSGMYVNQTSISGIKRTWSVGGCPFTPYAGGDAYNLCMGIDVQASGPTGCQFTAGTWCPSGTLPNLPVAAIYGATEWLGDTMYVQAPSSGTASNIVRKYTFGGTWSVGTPLPAAKAGGAMVACDGKLYFIGGGSSVTAGSNTVYEYDPGTGAWTTKATMPAALSGHDAVCWGDSVIFVYGGPWSTAGNDLNVYYYRVGSNTWGTIANSLPSGAGRRSAGAGIYGNKMVLCAGYKYAAPNFLKTTYIGTIGSNATQVTWATAPDVPVPYTGLSRMGGTSWDKYFFTVGGERGGGGYHDVSYVLDIDAGTWIDSIKTMPMGYSNIWNQVAAHCVDDTTRIFVPGGYSGTYLPNFYVTGCGAVILGTKTISETPTKYDLSQNYPNPFNPSTKISYSIPKNGMVTLKVYDVLGKEITTLVNEVKNPGKYIVEFNASNLSSGTYFYRIQAGDFVSIKTVSYTHLRAHET